MNSAFLGQCCLLNYHCRRLNRKPCSTWKTSVTFSLQQKHSMQGTSPGQGERGNGSVPKAVHSGTNIPSGRGGGAGSVPMAPPLLPFMLSSAVSPAAADDFGNCLFSPLLLAKLLSTCHPASHLQDARAPCKRSRCKAKFTVSSFP